MAAAPALRLPISRHTPRRFAANSDRRSSKGHLHLTTAAIGGGRASADKEPVMSVTSHAYTEQDVEDFFDQTAQTYLSFWDSEGVLHTGYFADEADEDYRRAAERTSDILAAEAEISQSSRVLDVGCGCGNFLIYLAKRFGCSGEGLDLSKERIAFAQGKLTEENRRSPLSITFRHGSATRMPYEEIG